MGATGVLPKGTQSGERPSAPRHQTVVVLLPRVREDVLAQGARIGESPCTILAPIGFLPRVRAHVGTQVARYSKTLVTRLALKAFLPRVRAHVLTQFG